MGSILVMVCSYVECSLYSVFDVEEGSGVYPTNLIWYFDSTAVESDIVINDTIKTRFCIVLKYNEIATYKSIGLCEKLVD